MQSNTSTPFADDRSHSALDGPERAVMLLLRERQDGPLGRKLDSEGRLSGRGRTVSRAPRVKAGVPRSARNPSSADRSSV